MLRCPCAISQSANKAQVNPPKYLDSIGSPERIPFSLMSTPNMYFMYAGPLDPKVTKPQQFPQSVMINAQTGTLVKMDFQGTAFGLASIVAPNSFLI